jgi:hypothetical protein
VRRTKKRAGLTSLRQSFRLRHKGSCRQVGGQAEIRIPHPGTRIPDAGSKDPALPASAEATAGRLSFDFVSRKSFFRLDEVFHLPLQLQLLF